MQKCVIPNSTLVTRNSLVSSCLLAPPFCWTKFPKKVAKSETKFPKISPKFAPKFAPKFFALSWQVEKSSPKISPDFPHRKLQIPNRISPKISQTHFCRLGSPKCSLLWLVFHRFPCLPFVWGLLVQKSCESWLAFLILEPCSPPAISCGFLPCDPRKPHFSAGKCIFLLENAFFCRKAHFSVGNCIFSLGKCIFLPENLSFCSLLWGAKNHEW